MRLFLFLHKFYLALVYTIILFLIFIAGLRYIKALNIGELNPWLVPMGFVIKVAFGWYFIYVYSEIYGTGTLSADAGAFLEESKILNNVFYQSPKDYWRLLFGIGDQSQLTIQYLTETHHWDAGEQAILSDNRNILRIQSVIHFFSFGNESVHILVMCFFSMIGSKQLYLGVIRKTELNKNATFFILLLIPSLLFWSSGILKEPFMFLGFGLFIRGLFGNDSHYKKWWLIISGAFLLISFKPYVLFCLIPAILFYFIFKRLIKFKLIGALTILLITLTVPMFVFKSTTQKGMDLISRKQFDFINVARGGLHANNDSIFYFFRPDQINQLVFKEDSVKVVKPIDILILRHGSMDEPIPIKLDSSEKFYAIYFENTQSDGYIPITLINGSFMQLIYNIPEALINVLFRPFFNDPGSWLKHASSIELILIYCFLIYAIWNRRKLSINEKGLIYSILIFIFLIALTIGWVTPVLGAIVRYRIPILLGFVTIGLIVIKAQASKSQTAD